MNTNKNEVVYQRGFKNTFETEALTGALPKNQNSPQKTNFNLYAEQISGTAFTVKRDDNLFSWMYRLCPSVKHGPFQKQKSSFAKLEDYQSNPNPLRWGAYPNSKNKMFFESWFPIARSGTKNSGIAIYMYSFDQAMENNFFYNSDAECMIVPESGKLQILSEMGELQIENLEIAVIPRGIKFQINPIEANSCRGYLCENFGESFRLPELGPIGANGLAKARDFEYPTAKFSKAEGSFKLFNKYDDELWCADTNQVLNVVAWHGNYAPYKYDLRKFNTINTVSYDHPDPSIFTVLTSPSHSPGVANIDFVIFPPRWMVAEHTFRPPYYHRNIMSEFMGLIQGKYDAKPDSFVLAGASIHNCMTAHGPDEASYNKAVIEELKPERYKDTMAFMFETNAAYKIHPLALQANWLDQNYQAGWLSLKNQKI